jgi:fibronectin type 3 domain-containing protein
VYSIYRGTDPGGPYPVPVASVAEPTTTFVDTGLGPTTTYYYVITAEDSDGNESDISNEAFATAP